MDKIDLTVMTDGNEVVIREGKALPLQEPKKIEIAGDIKSVAAYLNGRHANGQMGVGLQEVDKRKVLVLVSKQAGTITLMLDANSIYGTVITGKLEASDEVKKFAVNTETLYTKEQMVKLVKFSRVYFDDKDGHDTLLKSLMAMRIKTESDLRSEKDNRGNMNVGIDKKVTGDIPQGFALVIPVFKGFEAKKIWVEICYDVTDSSIRFWLESVELNDIIQRETDAIFADQLVSCEDFVIINQ